jgi:multidrug efflux pump
VYLVLAAQFESFVHPLVILAAVPLALTGALFGLWLFRVVHQRLQPDRRDHADRHRLQERHPDRGVREPAARSRRQFVEATIEAAGARLRPVLMTTLATAVGAVPLMIASGAGAESRQSIGATVFFGSVFAVALTLIVVPALYVLIARNTRSPQYLSRIIDKLRGSQTTQVPEEGDPAPQASPLG